MLEEVTTAIGTPNIALIKYWGKRNDQLNLPTNSSISMTLDYSLNTKTSIMFSNKLKKDQLYINGQELDISDKDNEKAYFTGRIIDELRQKAGVEAKALIVSQNSFPTSAGLASSASGAITLTFAGSHALSLDLSNDEISILSRKISGSACRSLYGGFAVWHAGKREDGSDSTAEQIKDEKHWPEVIDIVTLVSEKQKKVSTSIGHKRTTSTSDLYLARPASAEKRIMVLTEAIKRKDFHTLAEITMKDSNSMHAVMLDSYPPIMYMNDVSKTVIAAIHDLNEKEGKNIAAYTFDAGTNPQIITLEKNRQKVLEVVSPIVGADKVIVARQGSGPKLLNGESLINAETLTLKV